MGCRSDQVAMNAQWA